MTKEFGVGLCWGHVKFMVFFFVKNSGSVSFDLLRFKVYMSYIRS